MNEVELESAHDKRNRTTKPTSPAKETFEEFCDASTIHGMRYIGGGTRNEKVHWIIIFIISTTFCAVQIYNAYEKWLANPLIIGFDERLIPTSEIPFPAITVCNSLLRIKDKHFDYYETHIALMRNGTDGVDKKFLNIFELMSEQCRLPPDRSSTKNIDIYRFFINSTLTGEEIGDLFETLTGQELLRECSGLIKDSWWECKEGFTPIMTQHGMCWTFNMLNKNELVQDGIRYFYGNNQRSIENWSIDNGYQSKDKAYPFRSLKIQKKLGIMIEIGQLRKLHHDCWWKDLYLYVHHPMEVPHETKRWNIESALRKLTITPEILVASNDLKSSHKPEERQCYFDGERKLEFFKTYSKANCDVECLAKETVEKCGCALYWMPALNSTPICGFTEYDCYTRVRYRFTGLDSNCNCLRTCNTITYSFERETVSADYQQINIVRNMINSLREENQPIKKTDDTYVTYDEDDDNSTDKTGTYDTYDTYDEDNDNSTDKIGTYDTYDTYDEDNDNSTDKIGTYDTYDTYKYGSGDDINTYIYSQIFLWVQFSKPEFLAMRMSAQLSLTDFISQCGGLLGLFMGVSILSLVEVIYYFTIKLMYRVKQKPSVE